MEVGKNAQKIEYPVYIGLIKGSIISALPNGCLVTKFNVLVDLKIYLKLFIYKINDIL